MRDSEPGISRGSVALGVGILVLLLVALGGVFWWQAADKHRRTAPEAIEAELVKDPFAGKLFATMKQTHPKEFGEFTKRMSALMRNGTPMPQVQAEGLDFLRETSKGFGDALAQAPHAELAKLRGSIRTMLRKLQDEDVMVCAQFTTTGIVIDKDARNELRPLMLDANIALWKAAAAGRDRPAKRQLGERPSDEDNAALLAALRNAGMSDADFLVLTNPWRMRGAEPWRRCAITVFIFDALDSLPPDQADRITAIILRKAGD